MKRSKNNNLLMGDQVIALGQKNLSTMKPATKKQGLNNKENNNDIAAKLFQAGYRVIKGKKVMQRTPDLNQKKSPTGLGEALKRLRRIINLKRELSALSKGIKKIKAELPKKLAEWREDITSFYNKHTKLRTYQRRASDIIALVYGY